MTVGPIISAFYVGALILLLQLKPVQTLLAPLKYYGRMALTNYIGQTAMILIAGSVCNFAGNLTYMQTLYVCIAIYAIQIVFSVIWMKIFKMGPLEWVWRVITYWTVTPLKIKRNGLFLLRNSPFYCHLFSKSIFFSESLIKV